MIQWLIFLLLFVLALYKSFKLKNKKWLVALVAVLSVGELVFALSIYMFQQTNCGNLYDTDIGCMNALPSWIVPLGFTALAVATLLSIAILLIGGQATAKSRHGSDQAT